MRPPRRRGMRSYPRWGAAGPYLPPRISRGRWLAGGVDRLGRSGVLYGGGRGVSRMLEVEAFWGVADMMASQAALFE